MTQPSNVLMQPNPTDAVERPLTLVRKLEQKRDHHNHFLETCRNDRDKAYHSFGKKCYQEAINIVKQHSDWIDISVEPDNRTEFDSEVVLAIDVNGYTYNVTLANIVIGGEKKREWTECKAKWNGEFWEAVEYICQSEKLVAYKHIPNPPREVQDGK